MSYSPVQGRAALVNVIAVDVPDVPEFEDWYAFEHFPERLSIPGFLRGRRYVASEGPDGGRLGFYSIYETAGTEVLTSAAYLEKLDSPTDWTRRSVALFRTNERSACRITWAAGAGTTGAILLAEIRPGRGHADELRAGLVSLGEELLAGRRAASGYLLEADDEVTRAKDATAEGKVAAGGGPRAADDGRWYLVLERHGSLEERITAPELLAALSGLPREALAAEPAVREYHLVSARETSTEETSPEPTTTEATKE